MSLSRFGYTLLLYALLPRALLHLWRRARRQPEYLEHLGERFGRYAGPAAKPLIWIHAVSVGETRAAAPLIYELRRRSPRHRILLTHMTPTGRDTGITLFGDTVERCYLPYDFPFAVSRFLAHFKPVCGVLLETEIWPNLIHAARARQIPIYLANARMSEKSRRGYGRFRRFAAACLNELSGIAAQSRADADRLQLLGAATVAVTGNLKFDIEPDAALIERGANWREQWGRARPVLLCASTREGEEALLLHALQDTQVRDALILIVPRHPQRFDEVAALIEQAGIAYQRRSSGAPIDARTRIVLGDSMGEMFAYYAASDAAIIGGSLLPFGAQNLIEACSVGCPVIVGPHTYNFAEAVERALAAGAALQVDGALTAVMAAAELLQDPERARRMGEAGLAFAREHRGAAARVADLLRF
jgi:3-deoxy-D-manno-octulosonic-acid transferase